MATFTVQSAAVGGTVLTFNAVNAGGDDFTNNGRTYLICKNDNASTVTFDVVTTQTVDSGLAVADRQLSVASGDIEIAGPFSTNTYSTTVSLANYSVTASVTIAVFDV